MTTPGETISVRADILLSGKICFDENMIMYGNYRRASRYADGFSFRSIRKASWKNLLATAKIHVFQKARCEERQQQGLN